MPFVSSVRGSYGMATKFRPFSTALYAFSSHTFTTAGIAEGRTANNLAGFQSAYSSQAWASNTTNFSLQDSRNGYQLWRIPQTATYRIECAGAQGGISSTIAPLNVPGRGAIVRGDISLTQGQYLLIIVGQQAVDSAGTATSQGGGGGGTFVSLTTTGTGQGSLLMAAGGGAGIYSTLLNNDFSLLDGAMSMKPRNQYPTASTGTDGTWIYNGDGQGGDTWDAGGGAGWNSGGNVGGQQGTGTGVNFTTGGNSTPLGCFGRSYADGWIGGTNNATAGSNLWGEGGFGGGGGGHTGANGAGGGGGYTGGRGGGGTGNEHASGWGGGSYILPTATNVATSNGTWEGSSSFNGQGIVNLSSWRTAEGYVTITKL